MNLHQGEHQSVVPLPYDFFPSIVTVPQLTEKHFSVAVVVPAGSKERPAATVLLTEALTESAAVADGE